MTLADDTPSARGGVLLFDHRFSIVSQIGFCGRILYVGIYLVVLAALELGVSENEKR